MVKTMRRLFRFRLITLFSVVTVASILPAMHLNRVYRAQHQVNVTRELIDEGCFGLMWEWQYADNFAPVQQRPYSSWMEDRLGRDYLYSVATFDLDGHDDPQHVLQMANSLQQTRRIRLLDCPVDTTCCQLLQSFPNLQWLGLLLSPVDDAGMHEIAKIHSLAILDIRNTQITDAAIDDICSLPNLAWLVVEGSQISDEGVQELKERLPNCVVLNQSGFAEWPTIPTSAND